MTATITSLDRQQWRRPEATGGEEYTFADIYELCAFVSGEIRASKLKYIDIARRGNCCVSTVSKMASGETQYPRASTVFAILAVLGFQVVARR